MATDLTTRASILIAAPRERVWDALTTPALIKQWFFGVDTETDWVEGHPIVHRGEYQGVAYEDRGIIVRIRKPELLVHTHWSSVSGLSDAPEHYQEVTWSARGPPGADRGHRLRGEPPIRRRQGRLGEGLVRGACGAEANDRGLRTARVLASPSSDVVPLPAHELADIPRWPARPRPSHPTEQESSMSATHSQPRIRSNAMIALEVRDLIVEVGGKIVVEGLSFDLRPGDKVGVVGRNGAGKTSTMKVLTGEVEPAGGSVLRRGSVGYLRQDPRQHRAEDDDLALEHILAARGLVELSRSVEKARIALAESHDERVDPPLLPSRGGVHAARWLSGRVGGQDDRGRPRPAARATRRCLSKRALRWRASPPGARQDPVRRVATCCCSTSRRTTWTSTRRPG